MPQFQAKLSLIGIADLGPQIPFVQPIEEGAIPAVFAAAARSADFTAKPAETLLLPGNAGCDHAQRSVLLVGLGRAGSPEAAGAAAAAALGSYRQIAIDGRGLPRSAALGLALGAVLRAWRFPRYRQGPRDEDDSAMEITEILLVVDNADRFGNRWQQTVDLARAVAFTRTLVAEPSNLLTPALFIERLRALEAAGLRIEVLEASDLDREGLNLLAAVGRGSVNPPALVLLHWPGRLVLPPVVFVGKGMTFDTGGVSIKGADLMWEMRADMAGAAACAGAMLVLAQRNSPAPVTAVLALAENMVGADAYRPGDILRSHHGLTVEIIDTDAEGRLVLADALSFAIARLKPRAVIDVATLTYSVSVALGQEMAGLYANDTVLAANLSASGRAVGEPLWQLPVTDQQRDALASDIADIKQCLSGPFLADGSLAAAFISRFVGDTPWAHLDIGGVEARQEADERHAAGPTGFGVRLLDRLIALRYEDPDHP